MNKFILLTDKDKKGHKVLIEIDSILSIVVSVNNGDGHFCSKISMRNVPGVTRVVETPEEIMAQIKQENKNE